MSWLVVPPVVLGPDTDVEDDETLRSERWDKGSDVPLSRTELGGYLNDLPLDGDTGTISEAHRRIRRLEPRPINPDS